MWVAVMHCFKLADNPSLALQEVSDCCALLCLKSADNPCPWLFREWAAVVLWYVFKPADNPCPWLFRKWVAAVLYCVWSLLTISVLGSPVCEWLLCLAVFAACWQSLFLALQPVSGCCTLLCFKPTDNPCSWLSRKWVAAVPYCVSSLLTIPVLGSPACEWCCAYLCFEPTDNPCLWLSSWWVASFPCCSSIQLITPVLESTESLWLLCLVT